MQTQLHQDQNQKGAQKHLEQIKCPPKKKKVSILQKKKHPSICIFPQIDLKHVLNISDICFVNQFSLRNPEHSDQNILKTIFHYKMISKVTLNNSFVNIQLKKCQENYVPPEYFFQRLRSFGDRNMAKIADHLETIHNQFKTMQETNSSKETIFSTKIEEPLLTNFFKQMQGKKCFFFVSDITPDKINLKNIIFSIPMLKTLGQNLSNIGMDLLKYKHVFFEVFSAKNYPSFLQHCLENFSSFQKQMFENPSMTQDQREKYCSFQYRDEIIRTKQDELGFYEELNDAKVRWFSPHPSICCFKILDIVEKESNEVDKMRKKIKVVESDAIEEIQILKRCGLVSPILQIEG